MSDIFRDEETVFSLSTAPKPGQIPVTGAWREGDPVGDRRFVELGPVELEFGSELVGAKIAYESWGELSARRDNAVLIPHALTGDSHLIGPASRAHRQSGWWSEIVGPGKPIDTNRYWVICPNTLGGCQGSTGPASLAADGREYGSRFPYISIRDQAKVLISLARTFRIERFYAVIGASMGGALALELLAQSPKLAARFGLVAAPAYTQTEHIARNSIQIQIVQNDPRFSGGDYYDQSAGPSVGLSVARRLAILNYRGVNELEKRFGRGWQSRVCPYGGGGRLIIESYLDVQGNKFVRRFDANSYIVLLRAMNSHDVGRDRGGLVAVLGKLECLSRVIGIDSDRLFPLALQSEIAKALPGNIDGNSLEIIESESGHDAFLTEQKQVGIRLLELLEMEA